MAMRRSITGWSDFQGRNAIFCGSEFIREAVAHPKYLYRLYDFRE